MVLKELELKARVEALEASIGMLENRLMARIDAVEKYAKGVEFRLETVKLSMGHDSVLLDNHRSRIDMLEDENELVWMHFIPVMEKVFPGITGDLAKIIRLHKKDAPDKDPPPDAPKG